MFGTVKTWTDPQLGRGPGIVVGEMSPTTVSPLGLVTISRRDYTGMREAQAECERLRADLEAAQAELMHARCAVAELSRRPSLDDWHKLLKSAANLTPAVGEAVPDEMPARALRFSV